MPVPLDGKARLCRCAIGVQKPGAKAAGRPFGDGDQRPSAVRGRDRNCWLPSRRPPHRRTGRGSSGYQGSPRRNNIAVITLQSPTQRNQKRTASLIIAPVVAVVEGIAAITAVTAVTAVVSVAAPKSVATP